MKCAYNGSPIADSSDGIWDDGEWISWGYIDSQLEEYSEEEKPLNKCSYKELLQRAEDFNEDQEDSEIHLPIYGEIGELYIEDRFGLIRHAPCTQGSDGKIGGFFVEVKTISPMRDSRQVRVKRAGNFGVLAIVKIDADYRIDAKLIKRSRLPKGESKYIRASWNEYSSDHEAICQTGGGG